MAAKNRIVKPLEQIKQLHEEIIQAEGTALEKAIKVGELLDKQKAKEGHGNWEKWCKDNLKFSMSTVKRYMALYINCEIIKNCGSIRAAIEQLKGESKKTSQKKSRRKSTTRDRFKVTVKKDAPEELVKKLNEKYGRDFLKKIVTHIQRLNQESEQE